MDLFVDSLKNYEDELSEIHDIQTKAYYKRLENEERERLSHKLRILKIRNDFINSNIEILKKLKQELAKNIRELDDLEKFTRGEEENEN